MVEPLSAEELAPLTLLLKDRSNLSSRCLIPSLQKLLTAGQTLKRGVWPQKLLTVDAQSKSTVVSICRESFIHRNEKTPDTVLASVTKTLNIQPVEATKLLHSMSLLIRTVLYRGLSDAPTIGTVFPGDFHENLKGLLSDTIARNLPEWKATVLQNQVSLPRLVDFDWRVDVKISSDSVARMAQPTCLVQMKVADTPQRTDQLPSVRSLNVEFSKETLETMLDGLGKIRDQLSSVARSS